MGAKLAVHTFQGGMVKDLDKSLVTKERYLEARNLRLITNSGESTGAFENVEGNNNIATTITPGTTLQPGHMYVVVKGAATYDGLSYTLTRAFLCAASPTVFSGEGSLVVDSNELMASDMYIAGAVNIRNTIILFITNQTGLTPTAGHSKIVKITITDSTESIATKEVLYDDNLNNSTGYLRFSTANPIKAVAIYETPSIQKVYWCDGYNNVKYINTAVYSTTDGNSYSSGVNYYMEADLLEFLPEVTYSVRPKLDWLSPGNITAGIVQYAFQYFNDHGAETTMSPLSNTIHITTDNDYDTASYYYKGEGDINTRTGKSVRMLFTLDSSNKFNHIRVFRLFYKTVNSLPAITNVGEITIHDGLSTVLFTDNGTTSLGTLTLDEFSIGETELFSAQDLSIKSNRLFAANITKEEFSIGDWDARAVRFKSGSSATVTDSTEASVTITTPTSDTPAEWDAHGWSSYADDHDGINGFNDTINDGDSAYAWMYQSDGATLGAEGPNIKIGFTTDTLIIDANSSGQVFSVGTETTSDNKSYTNFASPYLSGRRSWQRDEVYRIYIVFFNAHGIASPAKWVCDLRMPSLHVSGYQTLGDIDGDNLITTALYPTVTIKSFPTGAVAAQLLRMERSGDDRTILTQAFVIPVAMVSAAARPQVATTAISNTGGMVKLVSPEINITKNISKGSSDYLEYVTNYTSADVTTVGSYQKYIRLKESSLVAYSTNCKTTIDASLYVVPRSNTDTFSFNAVTCSNYDSAKSAYGCSGMFIHHTNGSWVPGATSVTYGIVNYKRNIRESQYGGQTYESRENNVAIPASDIITVTGTPNTAWNGDTFIDFFEVSNELYDLTKVYNATYNENVYIPLESSINCALRHDRSASKCVMDLYSYNIQEVAGKWTNATGETFDQTTPLYQYNTVYSQEANAKFYVNVPESVSTDVDFDCMVRSSKSKISGEEQDSWTLFPVNDFIEVNTSYGPINTIENINDKLLFWQDNAFGVLSVNERSLIQDQGGAALVLGTGGILDRFDYISNTVGMNSNKHLVVSQTGAYWLYLKDKSIYRFSQNLENLSKSKLIQSWLEETIDPTQLSYLTIRGAYDKRYNEVLYSFYNSNSLSGETLVFNESIDAFSGFYDFYTTLFITYPDNLLSVSNLFSVDLLFYHNSRLNDRCIFHSVIPAVGDPESGAPTPAYHDSTIKLLFNDDYGYTKVFDNINYVSSVTSNDIDLYNVTFNSIRCYNDYQNSDYYTLTYGNTYTPSSGVLPLQRDEREWTLFVPRNSVSAVYTTNPDIFSAGNLSKTRQFRERLRDKYMITDFVFTNTSNRRLVVPYIAIKYRISYR